MIVDSFSLFNLKRFLISLFVVWSIFFQSKKITYIFNLNITGLFEGSFFWVVGQFDPVPIHISRKTNLISIYFYIIVKQHIQSKIRLKLKTADIICYMLTSLIVLLQGNVKKSKKSIKIVNIVRENVHIFWTTWGNSMKYLGKTWLMIILKVTKSRVSLFF